MSIDLMDCIDGNSYPLAVSASPAACVWESEAEYASRKPLLDREDLTPAAQDDVSVLNRLHAVIAERMNLEPSSFLLDTDSRTAKCLLDQSTWAALVSSRVSQQEPPEPWLDALAWCGRQLTAENAVLLNVFGTTCSRFIAPIASRLELVQIEIALHRSIGAANVARWLQKARRRRAGSSVDRRSCRLDLVPIKQCVSLSSEKCSTRHAAELSRDDWLIRLANLRYLLSMRTGGKTAEAIRRLQFLDRPVSDRNRWVPIGKVAVASSPRADQAAAGQWELNSSSSSTGLLPIRRLDFGRICDRPFFIHWTRCLHRPWPDQAEDDYLQELIFGGEARCRSAIGTLCRMLAKQRIFATNQLTRSSRRVVCFSKMSLEQFRSMRRYRSHLRRWDFDWYGLALDPEWLRSQGARPVIYGNDAVWSELASEQRPYFQKREMGQSMDWSIEKEWRIVGDLDLRDVPVKAAVVFVPQGEQITQLASVSRWPIVEIPKAS